MRETLPKLPEVGEPTHDAPEIKKESETEVKKICQLHVPFALIQGDKADGMIRRGLGDAREIPVLRHVEPGRRVVQARIQQFHHLAL
jgi:hypothetical protein